MKTIRELITEKSSLLRDIDTLGPIKVSEEVVELASLLSSLNAEIVVSQFALNQKRRELLEEAKSVAKARLLAEATEEWRSWFERVMQREALQELIRTCKYYLRAVDTERREFTR